MSTGPGQITWDSHPDPLPRTGVGLCNEEHEFLPSDDRTFTERCTALLCREHAWRRGTAMVLYRDRGCREEPIWERDEPQPDWSDFPCVTGYPPDHYLQHAEERAQWLRDSYVVIPGWHGGDKPTGRDPEYVRVIAERKRRDAS